jgi:hypothetical protein
MRPQSTGAMMAGMVAPQQPMPNFQVPELQTLPPGISGLVQDPLGLNANPALLATGQPQDEKLRGFNVRAPRTAMGSY